MQILLPLARLELLDTISGLEEAHDLAEELAELLVLDSLLLELTDGLLMLLLCQRKLLLLVL